MLHHVCYRFISFVVLFTLAIWSGFGLSVHAQESGSLKGVAVFEGEGMAFQLEDEQVYFVGDTLGSWSSAMTKKP